MIRVLIAEDQGLVRDALASLLELEADIEVVAQAADGEEALALAATLAPDVAVLDIEMPKRTGLEVAETLKQTLPSCRVLMLTTFGRPGYLQRAIRANVHGYLLKDAEVEELVRAIHTVHQGGKVISPALMMSAWASENPLTERETEILQLAARGLSTREMANAAHLSEGTVRNYLSIILSKLDVENRHEAVRIAEQSGWL